jgi:hypothetical protein
MKKVDSKQGKRAGQLAYKENPFWEPSEFKIGKKFVRVAGGMHVSDEGESVQHSGIHTVETVDKEEFVKLYTKNVKAIFDLKPSGQRVLQYLMIELQKRPNADAIYLAWIGAEEYFSEHNVKLSRSSFYTALKDLIEKGFLAESTRPNMFWFNPHLFFNGDRMTFIKEYKLKERESLKPKISDGDRHLQEDAFNDQ